MFSGRHELEKAAAAGRLLPESLRNIDFFLEATGDGPERRAVEELVAQENWDELNDRFYKTLAFGTGGLRGRTIGKIVTRAERGAAAQDQPPQFPCAGTNAMNFFNIRRATRGLVEYVLDWRARNPPGPGRPLIVIAHDTRHFSRAFAEMAAQVALEQGCDAALFDGPRSTPELSFAVRHLGADAGVVITASHNPPHDNGYKVYFNDGAQVVEPHASGIIARVNAAGSGAPAAGSGRGELKNLGEEIDRAYLERLETLILDREVVRAASSLRIIFTPIHGTGGVIIKPLLRRAGFDFKVVPEQDGFDGDFPTVKSPNPENAEALSLALALADREKADLVVATDPDCDRMGVAVRDAAGRMQLLTGNQIGSLMAWYRARTLFAQGVLNRDNAKRGVIIKTFVTTDLQKAIAEHFGLRCVETLTGFKYIGAKLGQYEQALGGGADYRTLSEAETRRLRLEKSSFYVFGGEESYGYSGGDFVRDKDGNGATLMFCEVAAYALSEGLTVDALLDRIYCELGYYTEKNGAMTFEGAEGADKIRRLVESYVTAPPAEMAGTAVRGVRDFARETIRDVEGDEIPKEKMLIFTLADETRIAVRASGTEPKIKYYLFAQKRPEQGRFSAEELEEVRKTIAARLDQLWTWLQKDAHARLGAEKAA